ncbi:hypothetical protein [Sphingopyxis sp. 113P3]|uniref:hypothetical protein n=1 Tax=Sphingopyxis sp. (strain 113P3) TaxID=292913 RepID=UPI0006AD21EC|nr:hypothetical protein [Sphingopyxis sp. 113P3]ALC12453.1 hypothetical protein LH20_10875 [Sphingopyxis sp. 113P3]
MPEARGGMEGEAAMISHGEGFLARHRSGRYLDARAHFVTLKTVDGRDTGMHDPVHPMATIFSLVDSPFAAAPVPDRGKLEEWLRLHDWGLVWDQWEIVPGPGCIVCGERWHHPMKTDTRGEHRCKKHHGRNPCAIEGCKRTTAAKGFTASDQYLCAEHWRRYVPARSRMRKLYFAHLRRGKRYGWNRKSARAFERLWRFIVKTARARHEGGFLDEAEINRIMGWDK